MFPLSLVLLLYTRGLAKTPDVYLMYNTQILLLHCVNHQKHKYKVFYSEQYYLCLNCVISCLITLGAALKNANCLIHNTGICFSALSLLVLYPLGCPVTCRLFSNLWLVSSLLLLHLHYMLQLLDSNLQFFLSFHVF